MIEALRPIVIIGAPRSGTNMLRNVLTKLPGVATWPCDEINYIWRHGNTRFPSDELPAELATDDVKRYVRRQFESARRRYSADTLVEKTCANSLRVDFVDRILPRARYVFIVREGVDSVGSAIKRWRANVEPGYLVRKAQFVPPTDMPYYMARFVKNRVHQLLSREGRLAFWGPQLENMSALLDKYSLEEVCALQWKRCVDLASESLIGIAGDRQVKVAYETFVRHPQAELTRLCSALELDPPEASVNHAVEGVSAASLGKGRRDLSPDTAARIHALIDETLRQHGYA